MLYDRSYMRPQETPTAKQASAVKTLLIVTIGIFVLQQIINVSFPSDERGTNIFLKDWFVLSAANFKDLKVWTVVTYAFLHDTFSIWHILGNMMGLFFMGRLVEPLLGKQRFYALYFGGAVIGGLAYLFSHFNDTSSVVGASAAVAAILSFFCMRYPEQRITLLLFFIIPLTVKPKWIFWGFLGISTYLFLFSELSTHLGSPGVAHSAHLGGFLTGVIYYRYIYSRPNSLGSMFGKTSIELPNWFKRRKKMESQFSYQVNRPTKTRKELQQEVDRILDKINTSGFSSLNDDEKKILDRAREILNH